jgi:hypothetical protein
MVGPRAGPDAQNRRLVNGIDDSPWKDTLHHSIRKLSSGSTRVARRAGM